MLTITMHHDVRQSEEGPLTQQSNCETDDNDDNDDNDKDEVEAVGWRE